MQQIALLLPYHEQHSVKNVVVCEESFGKNHALYMCRISH